MVIVAVFLAAIGGMLATDVASKAGHPKPKAQVVKYTDKAGAAIDRAVPNKFKVP